MIFRITLDLLREKSDLTIISTIADLAFLPWENLVPLLLSEQDVDLQEKYPNYSAWLKLLNERPAVKKVWEIRDKVVGDPSS